MTSPRSTYGGGYYASSSFPDTPIYDSLVAERGTPQIAPIRVSSPYDFGGAPAPAPAQRNLPALPALPSGPSSHQGPPAGYAAPAPQYGGQPMGMGQPVAAQAQGPGPGLQQTPAPYIPQQAATPPAGYAGQAPQPAQQRQGAASMSPAGFDAMRPVAPRPAQAQYEDPYGGGRPYPEQRGY
ncbi:DUF6643 family protein [Streptomyces hesseae]|uniref:DUF6643 family protein n=1 Tax=Streptomyces hesseae TaxID=3075519 RepID=A0ABU2SUH6_9ACTN|nr:DUF6643 family protein [Streptomyces sp. DSM 40473]MDT0452653.1 DUF6643 family protein [Streptomyces sp. DSM 40473]